MASSWSVAEAPAALALQVAHAFGQEGRLCLLSNSTEQTAVFMRFDSVAGQAWFLKLLRSERSAALADAERLSAWLQKRGGDVVSASFHKTLTDGRVLWAYPFHAGRAPQATEEDLVAIGTGLGQLHRSLAEHPEREFWLQATNQRNARLDEVRARLADGHLQAGPDPLKLQSLASDTRISFHPEHHADSTSSQPLHGDLNLFNMLLANGRCTFLDFEDVFHSVLPPVFDLATVYERVVLVRGETSSSADLLGCLLGAYELSAGLRIYPEQVPAVLRGLALRALCTLASCDPAGQDDKEWRKFFHLMGLSAQV
jgi:Ser/Thr protein kinase RdoA (MazF antagonist)